MNFLEFYQKRASWRNPREEKSRLKRVTGAVGNVRGRVLDVGCRDGGLRWYLPNIDYYGLDIVNFGSGQAVVGDASEGLSFKDKSFDCVFAIDTLEHLKNPYLALKEAFRVLRSGSRFVLSVPNPYHIKEIIWNLFKMKDKQGHIFGWTRQNMQKLGEVCGFRLLATQGTYFVPKINSPTLLSRSIIFVFRKMDIF